MRFMMFMIPAGYQGPEGQAINPEFAPPEGAVEKMMAYNEELDKAGVLIAMDGLMHPSVGARITYTGGNAMVTDGPFAESKEVVGGYWIIKTKTREEAIEWAKKVPVVEENDVVELRQIYDMEDYPESMQEVLKESALEIGV